jgi:LysR family glycine cleavage system transcriptional activator
MSPTWRCRRLFDGVGVALGYRAYVEADIVAGRLVAPFDMSLPSASGFDAYVVYPDATARTPELSVFREWLLMSAAKANGGAEDRPATRAGTAPPAYLPADPSPAAS